MKRCHYCGRQNEELALHCFECGTEFLPQAEIKKPELPVASSELAAEGAWTARDAWKFLGMFLVFQFLVDLMWSALELRLPGFRVFAHTGVGHFVGAVVFYAVILPTMLYFARLESRQSFLKCFGLSRRPSEYVWFALVVTLIIRWGG